MSIPLDIGLGSFIITRNKIGPNLVPCGTPPELEINSGNLSPLSAICKKINYPWLTIVGPISLEVWLQSSTSNAERF